VPRSSVTRLVAGTLVLALPLVAAAGCGAQKKRTIKAEFASARTNLENSSAASFTLRLHDGKHNVRTLMTKDGTTSAALADAVLGGSVTYVIDPAGSTTLKDVSYTPGADLGAQLKDVNLAFVIRDDKAALGEIRVVGGALYAHVDLVEIGRLAKAGGVEDFDAQLDDFVTSADPALKKGLQDVRAGKWIKLPLSDYLDQIKKLADSFSDGTGSTSGAKAFDFPALGQRLYDGVKPYVKVTDANDSSTDRVLDVRVRARPALKAALKVLAATRDLPFPNVFKDVDPAEVDANVKDGTANGTITLRSGHLSQVTVDVESIRTLAADGGTDSVAGTEVVFDVDDHADALTVPQNVSDLDLTKLIDEFLKGFSESFGTAVGTATAA
jgi:hypothetical protein